MIPHCILYHTINLHHQQRWLRLCLVGDLLRVASLCAETVAGMVDLALRSSRAGKSREYDTELKW